MDHRLDPPRPMHFKFVVGGDIVMSNARIFSAATRRLSHTREVLYRCPRARSESFKCLLCVNGWRGRDSQRRLTIHETVAQRVNSTHQKTQNLHPKSKHKHQITNTRRTHNT